MERRAGETSSDGVTGGSRYGWRAQPAALAGRLARPVKIIIWSFAGVIAAGALGLGILLLLTPSAANAPQLARALTERITLLIRSRPCPTGSRRRSRRLRIKGSGPSQVSTPLQSHEYWPADLAAMVTKAE